MHDSVTVHMKATPEAVWEMVSDITNTGRFSPETFEAEWLDGATGPAVGVKFRGHVRRNQKGPVYWTVCRITDCDPGRVFAFDVLGPGGRKVNSWRYELEPARDGVDVTESFRLVEHPLTKLYWAIAGRARNRTNVRGMRETLERIKAVVEAEGAGAD